MPVQLEKAELKHPRMIVCLVPTGRDGDVPAVTEEAVANLLQEVAVTDDDLVVRISHYGGDICLPRISIASWWE